MGRGDFARAEPAIRDALTTFERMLGNKDSRYINALLRNAPHKQKGKRETGETNSNPAAKDYRHPYYWASFIPSGDWRSLTGKG